MRARVAELVDTRELILNLTLRELRGKYKRSVLGWAWSMLNPLSAALIYGLVFRFFLRIGAPVGDPSGMVNFALFLLCGLLPWTMLSNGLNGAMAALVGNGNLVKKVYFPREILVIASTASWLYSFLIELAVLAVALLVFGNMVLPWLLPAVVLAVVLALFVLGIGLLLSVLNVYFRDTQHLFGIVMQAWFYATPIVYPISLVADADARDPALLGVDIPVLRLYELNPMVRVVEGFRDLLYDLRPPAAGDIVYILACTAAALAIGMVLFARLEGRLAEEL